MSFIQSVFFFFFKQKTAYELRISDWSSDVCSSDLDCDAAAYRLGALLHALFSLRCRGHEEKPASVGVFIPLMMRTTSGERIHESSRNSGALRRRGRSEEHTSELQSLMRISYAVFCLKKNKYNHILLSTLSYTNEIIYTHI